MKNVCPIILVTLLVSGCVSNKIIQSGLVPVEPPAQNATSHPKISPANPTFKWEDPQASPNATYTFAIWKPVPTGATKRRLEGYARHERDTVLDKTGNTLEIEWRPETAVELYSDSFRNWRVTGSQSV